MGNRGSAKVVFCIGRIFSEKWLHDIYRMRNAVILVVRMRGVATEAIKNMVLAGIGKLVIVDAENVAEEDLGCGFFFREEDVGRKVRGAHLPALGYLVVIHRALPET
jgi:molybdopterin/thiamine biosynthesis adenylyltransferase